jgi:hypothetical protein
MQKDMHLTNLTIPFDQGLVLPKNVLLTLDCAINSTTTVTTASTAGLTSGVSVTGAGIPAGAFIATVDNATQFTLTIAATATTASVALTFGTNVGNPSFISAKNGNAIIPVNSAATFEVNNLTVKGDFLPTQNTSITGATIAGGGSTSVDYDTTFDGYTVAQIVAILKVHGIVQ